MKPKTLPPCPCGQPAIEISCDVPRCAMCRQRELTYAGLHCHGENETGMNNAFAKYKHFFRTALETGKTQPTRPTAENGLI